MKEKIIQEIYQVEGLHCVACATSATKILSKMEGIELVRINYATQTALIEHDERIDLACMNKRLSKAGYQLSVKNKVQQQLKQKQQFYELKRDLLIAILFSLPIFILAMPMKGILSYENYITLLLTIPVVFWSGRHFFIRAWQQLTIGETSMDTLVAMGTGTAFLFSLFNTFFPNIVAGQITNSGVYYETSAILISFILLGRYWEATAKVRAASALAELSNLKILSATVLMDNAERELPIEVIQKGDRVLVRPGGEIPLDAIIAKGQAEIDESMLTGEAMPVYKTIGATVWGGTINRDGSLELIVEKPAGKGVLDQILELVEQAQASEAPIQKLVDQVSAIFVPVVILIAFFSGMVWAIWGPSPQILYATMSFATVLLIACPCALGLATPMAMMVGVGAAARKGILMKDGNSLQVAQKVNYILLDKTGTLTQGQADLLAQSWLNEEAKQQYLPYLIALEQQSEHPLAKAIECHYENDNIQTNGVSITNFKSKTGLGIEAQIQGELVAVGNLKFMKHLAIRIPELLTSEAQKMLNQQMTVLYFARKNNLLAVLGLKDPPKSSSAAAVKNLQKMGFIVHMLTGDNAANAKLVAEEMGVDAYQADLLPQDKIAIVKALQAKGNIVAMVGDGVNDAAALAQANWGVAMHTGTDVAIQTADTILLKSNLQQLVQAIEISAISMRTLKQNLFWAFCYNTLGIPIAAGVLYPFWGILLSPVLAGMAMTFSSLSVVLNSLWSMKKYR